jgi:hypothetical protein
LAEVDDKQYGEKGTEEGVSAKIGDIFDGGLGERTSADCAFVDVVDDGHSVLGLNDRLWEEIRLSN